MAEMADVGCRAGGDDDVHRCPRALAPIRLAAAELRERRREAAWALSLAARRGLAVLAGLGATVVVLVVLLAAWLPAAGLSSESLSPSSLPGFEGGQLAVLAALFGVIGACMSALQRSTTRPTMRVPALRAAMWASLTRPLIGAAAGLVVWALAAEGVLSGQALGLFGFAFAAGFSERVILRFIPDADGSSDIDRDADAKRGSHQPLTSQVPFPTTFRANVGLAVVDPDGRVLTLRRRDRTGAWQQLWHVFRLRTTAPRISPEPEFTEHRWVSWPDAIASAVIFRQPVYRQVHAFIRTNRAGAAIPTSSR